MRAFLIAFGLAIAALLVGAERDCRAQGVCATSECFVSSECGNRCVCAKPQPGVPGVCGVVQ
jgi:hypothetical protein